MTGPYILDRGDGPKIAGTRITVYAVLDYLRAGRSRDWIAAALNLSSLQVQAAIDYIRAHEAQVTAEYERIMSDNDVLACSRWPTQTGSRTTGTTGSW